MGFFDSSSKSSSTTDYSYYQFDPYKFWRNSGLMGVGSAGVNALMQDLQGAGDPRHSAAFRMGRPVLDQVYRGNRQQLAAGMTQRGTAFGGQARRTHANLARARSEGHASLLNSIRGERSSIAQALMNYAASTRAAPIIQPKSVSSTSTTTSSPSMAQNIQSGMELAGSGADLLGQIMQMLGPFSGQPVAGMPDARTYALGPTGWQSQQGWYNPR